MQQPAPVFSFRFPRHRRDTKPHHTTSHHTTPSTPQLTHTTPTPHPHHTIPVNGTPYIVAVRGQHPQATGKGNININFDPSCMNVNTGMVSLPFRLQLGKKKDLLCTCSLWYSHFDQINYRAPHGECLTFGCLTFGAGRVVYLSLIHI